MTRENIIRMAREAGGVFIDPPCGDCYTFDIDDGTLERFASLVAAAERDEILAFSSSEAFNRQHGERSPYAYELANAIRARGQA